MSTTTTTTQANDNSDKSADKKANESVTSTTTVTAAPSQINQPEKRGEVVIDEGADASVLKEQSADERLADARAEGLRNHEIEHANDGATNVGDPTSRDKQPE